MAGVLDVDERASREAAGDDGRVGERRDVVEIAVQDQRRHARIGGRRRRRRVGPRGRRPAQAGQRALEVGARPRRRRERRERAGGVVRERRAHLGGTLGHRRRRSPQLRIVVADDRQVERLRVEPRVAVGPVGGDRLGGEPEQRLRVAGAGGPGGGEDVAPHALVVEPRHQDLDERVLVDADMGGRAVAVGRGADDRVAAGRARPAARRPAPGRPVRPGIPGGGRTPAGASSACSRRGRPAPGRSRAAGRCRRARATAASPGSEARTPGPRTSRRSRRRGRRGRCRARAAPRPDPAPTATCRRRRAPARAARRSGRRGRCSRGCGAGTRGSRAAPSGRCRAGRRAAGRAEPRAASRAGSAPTGRPSSRSPGPPSIESTVEIGGRERSVRDRRSK